MSEASTNRPIRTPFAYRLRWLRHRVLPLAVWLCAVAAFAFWSQGRVQYLQGVGVVETRQIAVSPIVDGTVLSLATDLFDIIERGQIVAMMDDTVVGAELIVAEAEMARLRSTLLAERVRLESELAEAEAGVLNDMRRFQMDEEEARLQYLEMVVRQESDSVKLERLRIRMDRQRDLVQTNVGAENLFDETRLRFATLKKELEENELALAAAKQLMDRAVLRREGREGPFAAIDARDYLAPVRQALNVQEARISEIKQRRATLALRAPISGQVARIYRRPGETVLAGDPVLAITDIGTPRVLAYVDERSAGQIQAGDEVRLQSQGRPDRTVVARVARSGSAIEEIPIGLRKTPMFPEWGFPVLIIDIPRGVFLPGERLSVRVKATR